MSTIGIIQPNYIPWRGYFDFIYEVDVFVFFDDVQYTTRDWRNRNKIKTLGGSTSWLSVPVIGGQDQLITEVKVDNTQKWARKHLGSIRQNYSQTPYFGQYIDELSEAYEPNRYEYLVDLDIDFSKMVCGWLGLDGEFVRSSELGTAGTKDDKLLEIVQRLGGTRYLSGPAARDYMRPDLWRSAGVEVQYKDYNGYPEYDQISEPFEPFVSVLDLLFMVGPEAPDYIWGAHRMK